MIDAAACKADNFESFTFKIALKLEELESPNAFWNRLPIEAKFRIGVKLLGCENIGKMKELSKLTIPRSNN